MLTLGAKKSYLLKNGPKHWQAKDCGGGLKGRRRVSSSIPQFVRLFLRMRSFPVFAFFRDKEPAGPRGGGGGTPLNKLYRYVPPQRVGFMRSFGLETSIDFAYFGLESGVVFDRTTRVCERIYHFSSK